MPDAPCTVHPPHIHPNSRLPARGRPASSPAPAAGLTQIRKTIFSHLGASCHSVDDAREAEALGCTYITAGHIFATDCKRGIPPRGLSFLTDVCHSVHIPVYAIGGINSSNLSLAVRAGAAGICIMSGAMSCENPAQFFKNFEKAGNFHEIKP